MPIFTFGQKIFFSSFFFRPLVFFSIICAHRQAAELCAQCMQRGRREKGGGGGRGFKIYTLYIFFPLSSCFMRICTKLLLFALYTCKVRGGGGGGGVRGEGYFTQYTAGAKPTDSVPMRIKQE